MNYKGKDRIEFGYKNYAEASYGSSPGAVPTTLYLVGYCKSIEPQYDNEWNRLWVLRDTVISAPIAMLSRKTNTKLKLTWSQGTLAQYAMKSWLNDHENWFAEAKMYRDGSNAVYFFWTGLKLDQLVVRGSVGGDVDFVAELVGKLYDVKTTTIHSYGVGPGDPWEWKDFYLQVSTDGVAWTTIPNVTDFEFRIQNQLRPVYVFNDAASKQLSALEEMEQLVSCQMTMNMQDETWVDYQVDQTELYIKLMMPDSKYLQLNKGRIELDPILKLEDLIANKVRAEGRWLTHNFT